MAKKDLFKRMYDDKNLSEHVTSLWQKRMGSGYDLDKMVKKNEFMMLLMDIGFFGFFTTLALRAVWSFFVESMELNDEMIFIGLAFGCLAVFVISLVVMEKTGCSAHRHVSNTIVRQANAVSEIFGNALLNPEQKQSIRKYFKSEVSSPEMVLRRHHDHLKETAWRILVDQAKLVLKAENHCIKNNLAVSLGTAGAAKDVLSKLHKALREFEIADEDWVSYWDTASLEIEQEELP